MSGLDPHSPTVGVEAVAAVLAHLEAASGAATYLDVGEVWCTPERHGIFWLIERCREDVARLLGVEVDISIQRRDESWEEWDRRTDEALGLEPGEFLDKLRDLLDEGDEGAER